MKTIGLLGGMSWVSTHLYYKLLNQATAKLRGDGYQPTILLKSFDYRAFHELQKAGRADEVEQALVAGGRDLESIGADVLAICANTMHLYYEQVQTAVSIPVVHVADTCGAAIREAGFTRATLLGTKYTMEGEFYRKRLQDRLGIETIIPDEEERAVIERVIREELVRQDFRKESKKAYLKIIERYAQHGAQCAILGCTEIGLLVDQNNTSHPLFDTTVLHADALAAFAAS